MFRRGNKVELHYLDTVVDGDSKQNVGATLAIVDDLLKRVRAILPATHKDITFQSDNAGNYQNLILPMILPELAKLHGLNCLRILHTEAQDGKCIVDGHFQKVGWKIEQFVTDTQGTWATAREVCDAMQHAGGVPGTSVTLLRLSRDRLGKIERDCKALRPLMKRVCSVTKPLEWRYGQGAASDTIHATSVSAAAKVNATKRMKTYMSSNRLDTSLGGMQNFHRAIANNPRAPRGASAGGGGGGAAAAAAAAPRAKRRKTSAAVAASRPPRFTCPAPLEPRPSGETVALRALTPGTGKRLVMKFGEDWYGGW